MYFNKEQVLEFLPHRDPFLFIDSVEDVDIPALTYKSRDEISPRELIGASSLAHFYVREDLYILKGHFPGNPILPGVIQVEMMAQASTFTISELFDDPNDTNLEVALLGIESSKFRSPIRPGMSLKIFSSCIKGRGSFFTFDCKIYHGAKLMSQAIILATMNIDSELKKYNSKKMVAYQPLAPELLKGKSLEDMERPALLN